MQIRITLESDMLPGNGTGEAGGIDRGVVHTLGGLPYLPARRVKGCLREAALEVGEALEKAGFKSLWNLDLTQELFGYTGKAYAGWLRLRNANLVESTELEEWLSWLRQNPALSSYFNTKEILNYYTGLRAQTSIARATGGSAENTLRVSRVLKRGLVFIAEVKLVAPSDIMIEQRNERYELMQYGLALACAAWRGMGTSRNRGLGQLCCELTDETNVDLKGRTLEKLAMQLTPSITSEVS